MSERVLRAARENSLHWLDECLGPTVSGKLKKGGPYVEIAHRYHELGILSLLLDADPDGFRDSLCKAGQVYLDLLERVAAGAGIEPEAFCTSKSHPFADALAAGDVDLAKAIARLSPQRHFDDIEYEDDFLAYHVLHRFVATPTDEAAITELLDRWEVVLDGNPSTFLNTSRALLDGSEKLLDDALAELLDERETHFKELRKSPSYREEIAATEGVVFVRGLAILRVAEMRGIPTRSDYRFMPSLARIPLGGPLPPPVHGDR